MLFFLSDISLFQALNSFPSLIITSILFVTYCFRNPLSGVKKIILNFRQVDCKESNINKGKIMIKFINYTTLITFAALLSGSNIQFTNEDIPVDVFIKSETS